jgi:hypothetical protein
MIPTIATRAAEADVIAAAMLYTSTIETARLLKRGTPEATRAWDRSDELEEDLFEKCRRLRELRRANNPRRK